MERLSQWWLPACSAWFQSLSRRLIMFSTDFSIADIFSPLDEDVGFLPRFNIGSEWQSYMPVVHEKPRCLPPTPVYYSIPRKPVPRYDILPSPKDSIEVLLKDKRVKMEHDGEVEVSTTKRGWRFYGSFACLALLNLICAIDATILSVALPVRRSLRRRWILC
jgi:hypothetical protein